MVNLFLYRFSQWQHDINLLGNRDPQFTQEIQNNNEEIEKNNIDYFFKKIFASYNYIILNKKKYMIHEFRSYIKNTQSNNVLSADGTVDKKKKAKKQEYLSQALREGYNAIIKQSDLENKINVKSLNTDPLFNLSYENKYNIFNIIAKELAKTTKETSNDVTINNERY